MKIDKTRLSIIKKRIIEIESKNKEIFEYINDKIYSINNPTNNYYCKDDIELCDIFVNKINLTENETQEKPIIYENENYDKSNINESLNMNEFINEWEDDVHL